MLTHANCVQTSTPATASRTSSLDANSGPNSVADLSGDEGVEGRWEELDREHASKRAEAMAGLFPCIISPLRAGSLLSSV